VPIFNAVLAFGFFREARVSGLRLLGLFVGFVGVALLVGAQPHGKLLAALAVVAMALCYAIGALLAGRHLRGTSPLVVALASTAVSTVGGTACGDRPGAGAKVGTERRLRRSSSSASSARPSRTSSSSRSSSGRARTTRRS